ncbi:MAG: hypothetical protein PHC45_01060 [Clostridiaceae bacterium]|nr:hypothetical protein [Clostridiaceae bacterium]
MKAHIIYTLIGISTLVLNIILTFHIIKKYNNENYQNNWNSEEVITFKLTGAASNGDNTTAAVLCDDTAPLK